MKLGRLQEGAKELQITNLFTIVLYFILFIKNIIHTFLIKITSVFSFSALHQTVFILLQRFRLHIISMNSAGVHFNSLNLFAFSLENYTNWWLIYKVWLIYWAVSWACGAGWHCQCRFEIITPPQDLLCSCFTLPTCYCTLQNKATKKSCFELVCVCFGICTVIYLWFFIAFGVIWSDICIYIFSQMYWPALAWLCLYSLI